METNILSEVREHRIPARNIGKLQDGFAKLAKRAAKLGVTAPTFTEVRVEKELEVERTAAGQTTWVLDDGTTPTNATGGVRFFHIVTVQGEAPHFAGWHLIGIIEHLFGEGNLIRKVPTVKADIPAEYRDAAASCDHCKTIRNRKETFVLQHDDSRFVRVGRQCLCDFLPGVNPDQLANGAEIIFSAESLASDCEDGFGGSGGRDGFNLTAIVAMANACILKHGWTSRTSANAYQAAGGSKCATADDVRFNLDPPKDCDKSELVHPTDADREFAGTAVAWAQTLDETADHSIEDYEHNLNVLAKSGFVPSRYIGIASSLANAFRRHLGILEERKVAAVNSAYVGEIGTRISLTVTVVKAIALESEYGPCTLYVLRNEVGNSLKWFASGNGAGLLDIGQTYAISGRVEKHEEYKGVKFTQLSRVKVNPTAEELAAAAAAKAQRKAAEKLCKAEKKALVAARAAEKVALKAYEDSGRQWGTLADNYRQAQDARFGAEQDFEKAVAAKLDELFPRAVAA